MVPIFTSSVNKSAFGGPSYFEENEHQPQLPQNYLSAGTKPAKRLRK